MRIPGAKRRVIIADAGHVVVVGIDVLRADGRRLVAPARNSSARPADKPPINTNRMLLLRFTLEAAEAIQPSIAAATMMHTPRITAAATMAAATFLFSRISLVQIAGRAFVEKLVADDRRRDADGDEEQHVADGFARAIARASRSGGSRFSGLEREGREETAGTAISPPDVFFHKRGVGWVVK